MINNLLIYLRLYIVQIQTNVNETENDMSSMKFVTIIANAIAY